MASSQHYDDSDSDGANFNPAPADASDDEQQPSSPVESRNGARRSSLSRGDDDHDGDTNGDAHSVNGPDDESDNEGDSAARKAARDDDEDEDDDDDEEDEDEDDDDMPVRDLAPLALPPDLFLGAVVDSFSNEPPLTISDFPC
jgi:transcription elongation factor SPT5